MSGGIDAARQSADHGQPGVGELVGKLLGRFRAVMSRAPRADNANGVMIALLEFAPNVEHDRRRMNFAQRLRIRRRFLRDNSRAEIADAFKLRGKIDGRFPVGDLIRDFVADSFHLAKLAAFRREDLLRVLEKPRAVCATAPAQRSAAC